MKKLIVDLVQRSGLFFLSCTNLRPWAKLCVQIQNAMSLQIIITRTKASYASSTLSRDRKKGIYNNNLLYIRSSIFLLRFEVLLLHLKFWLIITLGVSLTVRVFICVFILVISTFLRTYQNCNATEHVRYDLISARKTANVTWPPPSVRILWCCPHILSLSV